MISVGIIGGTGYTGKKLLQICRRHKQVDSVQIYGKSTAGESIFSFYPELKGIINDQKILSAENISYEHDIYFTALPTGEALNYIPTLILKGKKVIDLGGDFRFDDSSLYPIWYGIEHNSPDLLQKKIYGLADVYVDYNTNLIANPGCYPTSVLLSLLPLKNYSEKIVSINSVSYSGTSGAGKSPKPEMLLSEMYSNVAAYNVNNHRHQPEIEQELMKSGINASYSLTTHLLPIPVGIYSTSVVNLNQTIDEKALVQTYNNFYKNKTFVRIRKVPPNLKWVINTNYCDINISVRNNTIVITSTIDNLIKGAAGQAVQNMNKLFGFKETEGLEVGYV